MKKATRIVALLLLSVMCVGLLVACAPNSDPAKAEEALKKNGYSVTRYNTTNLKTVLGLLGISSDDGLETYVLGTNEKKLSVTILYFDDNKNAKAYWDEHKSDLEAKNETAGCSGKVVYYGHKDAVNSAR